MTSKFLLFIKLVLIAFLISPIYWVGLVEFSETANKFIIFICGILIIPCAKSSVLAPSFNNITLKGIAHKIPMPLALCIFPFLFIIPLGFQGELMTAFLSWVETFRNFFQYSITAAKIWILVKLSIPLLIGGAYLLFIFIVFQVLSKKIIDFCFEKEAPTTSPAPET